MVRPRPPISAATLAPTGNSPPGQDFTSPTHSMPLTFAASAHSPRRMCISAWLIPNALISKTIARMLVLQVVGSGSRCEEVADDCSDLCGMRFQREVTGVEEADDCSRN